MMRRVIIVLGVFISTVGCIDVDPEPQNTFRKVVGGLGQSLGRKLIKMDDGTILLLGSESIVAKREVQLPNGTAQTEFIRQIVPSLVKLDQQGNVVKDSKRLFPMYQHQTEFGTIDIHDAGEIIDIMEINGGYFAVAKWTETYVRFPIANVDQYVDDWVYFMILDEQFNLVEYRSMNGESIVENFVGPDPTNFRYRDMVKLDNGKIVLLTGTYSIDPVALPASFSLWLIGTDGQVESINYYPAPSGLLDHSGLDIELGANGNIAVLTRLSEYFYRQEEVDLRMGILEFDPNTLQAINSSEQEIDLEFEDNFLGQSRFTRNTATNTMQYLSPMHFTWNEMTSEYAVFYFHRFNHFLTRTDDTNTEVGFSWVSNDVLSMAEVTLTSDGGYLTLSEPNDELTGVSSTIIKRFDSSGNQLWRRDFPGYPRSAIQTEDGGFMFVTNPFFNDIEKKTTITKLNGNGDL